MPDSLTPTAFRDRVSDLCRELAQLTGDDRFARAAGVLRGKRAGRRAADDAEAADYAAALLRAGLAKSKRDAALRAAKMYSADKNERTRMRERLRKKIGDK